MGRLGIIMASQISTTKVYVGLDARELAAFVARAKRHRCTTVQIVYERVDFGLGRIAHEVSVRASLGLWKAYQKWEGNDEDPNARYDYLSTPHASCASPVRLRATTLWDVRTPAGDGDYTYVVFSGMLHAQDESVKRMRTGMR